MHLITRCHPQLYSQLYYVAVALDAAALDVHGRELDSVEGGLVGRAAVLVPLEREHVSCLQREPHRGGTLWLRSTRSPLLDARGGMADSALRAKAASDKLEPTTIVWIGRHPWVRRLHRRHTRNRQQWGALQKDLISDQSLWIPRSTW